MSNSEDKELVISNSGHVVVRTNQPQVISHTGKVIQSGSGNQVDIVVVFDTTGKINQEMRL